MTKRPAVTTLFLMGFLLPVFAGSPKVDASGDMQRIGLFAIDRTEVTIGVFERFAAATGFISKAERSGGGLVYAAGWVQQAGWTWHTPFGRRGVADEPAAHITFDEAQTYCRWAGKCLPGERGWVAAAYAETRPAPLSPFEQGRTYQYPTGDSPKGAN